MGCGVSKKTASKKYANKRKEAWSRGDDDDIESRTSSEGVVASESPMTLKMKQRMTVISSYVFHGIRSNVDQFEPPHEEFSESTRRKLEDWVDEHLQFTMQAALMNSKPQPPDHSLENSGFSSLPPSPKLADTIDASDVPAEEAGREYVGVAALIDMELIGRVHKGCSSIDDAVLQLPIGRFLVGDETRRELDPKGVPPPPPPVEAGISVTDMDGHNDSLSPFQRQSTLHASSTSTKNNLASLKSTRSFVQRALTSENLKHFNKSWGKAVATFKDELKEAHDGKAMRPLRILTLRSTLFGPPFTSIERCRLEAINDSMAERLRSPTGAPTNALFLNSPTSPSPLSRTNSHTTSTATADRSDDEGLKEAVRSS